MLWSKFYQSPTNNQNPDIKYNKLKPEIRMAFFSAKKI